MLPIWNVTNETKLCVGGGYEGSFAKVVLKLYSCLLRSQATSTMYSHLRLYYVMGNKVSPNLSSYVPFKALKRRVGDTSVSNHHNLVCGLGTRYVHIVFQGHQGLHIHEKVEKGNLP